MAVVSRALKNSPLTATDHDENLRHHVVDVTQFGVVGDGTTDNSTNLIAMRDWCEANRQAGVKIFFPPGHYVYTNNQWVPLCDYVEIEGYGAQNSMHQRKCSFCELPAVPERRLVRFARFVVP